VGIGLFLERFGRNHFGFPELILLAISLIGVSGKLADIIYRLPGAIDEDLKNRIGGWRKGPG